jgi:DNA-binding NarL/FixJ family response regulator
MRILLADRQSRVRSALRLLLEQHDETFLVTEASDGAAVLAGIRDMCPDLLLLDWELPSPCRETLIAAARQACPRLAIIVLDSQPQVREAALHGGADGFVSKNDPPEALMAAVATVRRPGAS